MLVAVSPDGTDAGRISSIGRVTSGRTATIVRLTLLLASLAWIGRPIATAVLGDAVLLHSVPVAPRLVAFTVFPTGLIVLLVVICLNRVLLHAVAWCTAGAVANCGELITTRAVADYIPVGEWMLSPGDVWLTIGTALLGLGAVKVVADGIRQ